MAKSTYIGKKSLPTHGEMVRELLAWWSFSQRNPERHAFNRRWYWHAQADCQTLADKHDLTLHTVCQVVAAISPGKQWNINMRDAELIIEAWKMGLVGEEARFAYLGQFAYQTGYTWENTRNAFAILDNGTDIPEERTKTFCFAQNLEFPGLGKRATMDLHMGHILGKTRKRGPVNINAVYADMEHATHTAARLLGVLPEELQGAAWGARVDAFEAGYDVDTLCDLVDSMESVESYV